MVLIFFAIAGCTTTRSVTIESLSKVPVNDNGYFFGSCKRGFMGLFTNIYPPQLSFNVIRLNHDGTNGVNIFLNHAMKKSGEKDVFAFSLEPGNYKIISIGVGRYRGSYDIPFTIKKGTLHYYRFIEIGNIFLANIIGLINVRNKDDFERDAILLKDKFPKLNSLSFEKIEAI
jgi:hypothetical protein